MQETMNKTVMLDRRGISIRGRREIALCGSLFYFRIPQGLWADRMRKLRLAGYNTIDVYFPWNFHEVRKDEWDFDSEMHDAERFLSLAAEHDLYVIARPGPYICSEWDGGGLPAYLFAERLSIRQNDEAYLARVEEWYSRIVPIIARHQMHRGGSVVVFQVENELDFYACHDRRGYIAAVAEMARRYGIEVPLIGCAGQGDIYSATGGVASVVPAMNLYFPSFAPGLEAGVRGYSREIGEHDAPLMVTEMGRENLLMRRYLAGGAKLLGPYNQVGGFDFGFTNSINNWGSPVSFQTSDYDFASLVSPYGEVRDAIGEDRILASFIATMGPALAGAAPLDESPITAMASDGSCAEIGALELDATPKGFAVSIANVSADTKTYRLEGERVPVGSDLTLASNEAIFAIIGFELRELGIDATIEFATAEPISAVAGETPMLVFSCTERPIVLIESGGSVTRCSARPGETETVALADGSTLLLVFVRRADASLVAGVTNEGIVRLDRDFHRVPVGEDNLEVDLSRADLVSDAAVFPAPAPAGADRSLEANGAPHGFGRYGCSVTLPQPMRTLGVVLDGASDVASVSEDGRPLGTYLPGGASIFIASEGGPVATRSYSIRTEIWGHSNFDDPRTPALRMHATRGLRSLTAVTTRVPLVWWQTPSGGYSAFGRVYTRPLGDRLTTDRDYTDEWWCDVDLPPGDSFYLQLEGLTTVARVTVDGVEVGRCDEFMQVVDLGGAIRPGARVRLGVVLEKRHFAESAGIPWLIGGYEADGWTLALAATHELDASAEAHRDKAVAISLPATFAAGSIAWVFATLHDDVEHRCQRVRVSGRNVKVTILFNGTVCGRLYLPSDPDPTMAGGQRDLGYLPSSWFRKSGNRIAFLVESVGVTEGVIDAIAFESIG